MSPWAQIRDALKRVANSPFIQNSGKTPIGKIFIANTVLFVMI